MLRSLSCFSLLHLSQIPATLSHTRPANTTMEFCRAWMDAFGLFGFPHGEASVAMALQMVGETRATETPELLEMATMFHYGLSPALLMVGLTLIMIRSCALETAKNALIAYIIGSGVLLTLFFTVFTNASVMDFSVEMAAPDILAFALAIFGLIKAK